MSIDSPRDWDGLRRAGRVVADMLTAMEAAVRPGITTADLDEVGAALARKRGARSAPHLVYGFPGFNLISVNDEIVHGVPGSRRLGPGDVVKIDVTAELDGYIADAANTVIVPPAAARAERLRRAAIEAFDAACAVATAGAKVSAIGRAVDTAVRARGFAVIRPLTGHGVGRTIHEPPTVPNYFDRFQTDVLTEGLVLTIEPIIAERSCRVVAGADGWTLRTSNHTLAAHYEHTLAITGGRPVLLTA